MKKWRADVELFWDASQVVEIEVKANTVRKARMLVEKKAIKNYGWKYPVINNIVEVD